MRTGQSNPGRDELSVEQNTNIKKNRSGEIIPWNKGILKIREIKMRKTILLFIPVLISGLIIAGCGNESKDASKKGDSTSVAANKGERKVLYWYDPMTPTVHFDHPGKSPTMDMDLVPMYADQEKSNPNIIRIDPAMVQDIGVVTAPVERRRLTRTINTYGVVTPDEKSISDINTRVGGWIEQLSFDYTGMDVKRGQDMAVIYSPELIAAEQEFLQSVSFAETSGNSSAQFPQAGLSTSALIRSARERLAFFGMSDKQIDELQSTGKVIERVVIHSPSDGVILEKDVFEGQKISSGQTLFRVANLYHVWILADVFKVDMPFFKMGSPVTVTYNNSVSFTGRSDFVYPEVDATARSVKVRIPLNNPGMVMKVGQYVNAAIHSPISYDALAVPSQAVINTGLRQVVAVVLGGGRFEIRELKLGAYADGYYEVTDGLNEGDTIVTSGQFLIDSDANLKSAGTAMAGAPVPSSPQTQNQENQNGMENMPRMKMNVPQKNSQPRKKTAKPKKESMDMMDMPGMHMGKGMHNTHEGKKDSTQMNMDGMGMSMPGMNISHDSTNKGH